MAVKNLEKDPLYSFARMGAQRIFSLSCTKSEHRVSFRLIEENGLEEITDLGGLLFCPTRTNYTYQERCITPESVKAFSANFEGRIHDLERIQYRSFLLKRSIPEFERMIRGEIADDKLVRQAYWAIVERKIPNSFFSDAKEQEIYLQAAKDCCEDNPARGDMIFIDGMHLLSRIWGRDSMLFTPITYYLTPFAPDCTLIDEASAVFRRELKKQVVIDAAQI